LTKSQQQPAAAGGVLARLDRLYSKLEDVLNYIAGAIVFALMLFVCAEVFSRTALNRSIYGFLDMTELTMAAFAFLGAAYCQRLGGHIRMDIAVGLLRGRWLWVAEAVATLVAMIVFALLIKGTWDHFMRAWTIGDTSIDAEIRTWPSKLLAPVGLSVLWLRLLLNLCGYIRLIRDPDAEPIAVPPGPGASQASH
jgi:TRAP-type C4-dicarboxylate transport system permease small subunit